jgi:hypothetical protein
MAPQPSTHIGGMIGLPGLSPGTIHRMECPVTLDDERVWRVVLDMAERLVTVFDEKGEAVGWTEWSGKGVRQVVLPGEVRPPVFFQDKLFSRLVWIGDTSFKAVMMLEGRKRVFGDDRIRLEHRDFQSEARFSCLPEFLVPGIIVAAEVYAGFGGRTKNARK